MQRESPLSTQGQFTLPQDTLANIINRIHQATLETSAGSDQVAASSRELSSLADQLEHKVKFFKIA